MRAAAEVRDVPLTTQAAGPRPANGCPLIPVTSGNRSNAIKWCRSSHDSYTTWPRIVADHHHPGMFR